MRAYKILLFMIVTAACTGPTGGEMTDELYSISPMEEISLDDASTWESSRVSIPPTAQRPPKTQAEIVKKVVKTADLSYKVNSGSEEYARINDLLNKHEAFIASENENKGFDRINYHIAIKVEPENFDALIAAISESQKLDHRSISVDDVTEKYYDLKSRIENKEKLEERFQEILKKAETVKEMLEVERNLSNVRTEIESLKGRFKVLSHKISYSTIDLTFYELLPYDYETNQRPGFGKRMANAFSGGWNGFLSFLVLTVRLWPFVLMIVGAVVLVKRVRRKKKMNDL